MGLLSFLSGLVYGVNVHFGSEFLGLSASEFAMKKRDDVPVTQPADDDSNEPNRGESSSSSSDENDTLDYMYTEDQVFEAMHQSDAHLQKMMEENPDDFAFITDDMLELEKLELEKSSSRNSSQSQVVKESKTHTPRQLSASVIQEKMISKDNNERRSLSWEVDTSGFEKPKKKRHTSYLPVSKLPKKVKSAAKKADVSSGWRNDPDILKDVDRSQIPNNTAEQHLIGSIRKVLDIQRWYCISRPQYHTSCGISSVVSCWNYLYSTLGRGSLKPITQEEALYVLGFRPEFSDTRFGPFTGNATLMRWFYNLNEFYGTSGRAYLMYKPRGARKTVGISSEKALLRLKEGLKRSDCSFVYHCANHYFCPIGYEETPLDPKRAYCTEKLRSDEKETWVLIGDTSKKQPSIHSIKWDDIATDLNAGNPDFYDIRRLWKGKQKRKKQDGGNLHCLIAFEKSVGARSKHSDLDAVSNGSADEEEDLEDN